MVVNRGGGICPNSKSGGIIIANGTSSRTPRIRLKEPEDARRLVRRVLAEIFAQDVEVENAGKIANLITVWLKAFESEKLSDLEKRIAEIEQIQSKRKW